MPRPTWIEINLDDLRHNAALVKSKLAESVKLMAVVKAGAYGHGAVEVSRCLLGCGADMLCVVLPEEGVLLRNAGITAPILVLGGAFEDGVRASVEYDLIQTVYDADSVKNAENIAVNLNKTALLDLKIDTGMNRTGVKKKDEAAGLAALIKSCPHTRLFGVHTHFAASEDNEEFTRLQYDEYMEILRPIMADFPDVLPHASNSAGVFLHGESHLGGVRCGIALYGSEPKPGIADGLRPILSWKTKIMQIKDIEEGETVGYGRTYRADGRRTVATLPVGYGDGYRRILGGRASVLIGGKAVPVIGRVSMDWIVVDITGVGARVGDEAVLIGKQGDARITPWDMALWADTIPYEITLSITPRVQRIYTGEAENG